MANQEQRRRVLAAALRAPIAAGDLEATLAAARRLQLSDPGHDDAKSVVEALELLIAQVWYGGAPEGGEPNPDELPLQAEFVAAADALSQGQLGGALARYRAVLEREPNSERAARLAHRVRVVEAALMERELPAREAAPAPEIELSLSDLRVADLPFVAEGQESTRVAKDGELPLAALRFEDVTAPVRTKIPADAYPDEPTTHLRLGDFNLVEESEPPRSAHEETTRVAKAGELPLDQLREEMEAEKSDAALDGLLDELDGEEATPATEVSAIIEAEPKIPHVDDLQSARVDDGDRESVDDSNPGVVTKDPSWVGVRREDLGIFDAGVGSVAKDQWESSDVPATKDPRAAAELMIARGELTEALRAYQELATQSPHKPELWDRVAEIAKMIHRRSHPEGDG